MAKTTNELLNSIREDLVFEGASTREVDELEEAITTLRAENKRLRESLRGMIDVARREVKHRYDGKCPDANFPNQNDDECPACQIIMRAQTLIP